jgi:NTP pyrophosphatase (non-canonical NTP hydrolase)
MDFLSRDPDASTNELSLSLADAQRQVDAWIQEHGVRYFAPLTNLAQLMEEVGELARLLSRTYGEQSFKAGEDAARLPDEFADVLFVLLCLANQTGVDLTQALAANLAKKTSRDRDRHKQNPKLQVATEPPPPNKVAGEGQHQQH